MGSRSPGELAERLVTRLAGHYGWHHVSLFQVREAEQVFHLLAQHSESDILPKESRRQEMSEGVLGYVYATRESVNIPDLRETEIAVKSISDWPEMRSELCLPLVWEGEVQWLLNVEDKREDCFSIDEENKVRRIVEHAQLLLARISRQSLLESTFRSGSDAVFSTDSKANILDANQAAAKLLGYEAPEELSMPFREVFHDKQTAERIFEATGPFGREVELERKNGSVVPVLISGADLPEEFSRKLFTAKDLRVIKRMEKLESLKKLFEELAVQSHAPLALVTTWVQQLKRGASVESHREWATKVLGQLKKLEISYDRLALCVDAGPVLRRSEKQRLDLGIELKRTVEEFPASEGKRIRMEIPDDLQDINGDAGEISFIFSSILAYLLRSIGDEDAIKAEVEEKPAGIRVRFSAPATRGQEQIGRRLARAKFDLALGESTIQAFASDNSASYEQFSNEDETRMELTFAVQKQTE
ncbi:MAG: GAF domain-containing protein [Bryobacteraceae bacterium]